MYDNFTYSFGGVRGQGHFVQIDHVLKTLFSQNSDVMSLYDQILCFQTLAALLFAAETPDILVADNKKSGSAGYAGRFWL